VTSFDFNTLFSIVNNLEHVAYKKDR